MPSSSAAPLRAIVSAGPGVDHLPAAATRRKSPPRSGWGQGRIAKRGQLCGLGRLVWMRKKDTEAPEMLILRNVHGEELLGRMLDMPTATPAARGRYPRPRWTFAVPSLIAAVLIAAIGLPAMAQRYETALLQPGSSPSPGGPRIGRQYPTGAAAEPIPSLGDGRRRGGTGLVAADTPRGYHLRRGPGVPACHCPGAIADPVNGTGYYGLPIYNNSTDHLGSSGSLGPNFVVDSNSLPASLKSADLVLGTMGLQLAPIPSCRSAPCCLLAADRLRHDELGGERVRRAAEQGVPDYRHFDCVGSVQILGPKRTGPRPRPPQRLLPTARVHPLVRGPVRPRLPKRPSLAAGGPWRPASPCRARPRRARPSSPDLPWKTSSNWAISASR